MVDEFSMQILFDKWLLLFQVIIDCIYLHYIVFSTELRKIFKKACNIFVRRDLQTPMLAHRGTQLNMLNFAGGQRRNYLSGNLYQTMLIENSVWAAYQIIFNLSSYVHVLNVGRKFLYSKRERMSLINLQMWKKILAILAIRVSWR